MLPIKVILDEIGRVNYVVFSHAVLEEHWVKLLHAVVNEGKHGSARFESEPCDEVLTWLETSGKRHIEFFSFLTRHLCRKIKQLVTTLSVDKKHESHQLIGSFSVHLRCEQRVTLLNISHLVVKFVIISHYTDSSVDARLNLDGAEAEHGHCRIGMPSFLWTNE